MSVIRLFHWRASEAEPLRAALRAAGYEVSYDEKVRPEVFRTMCDRPPDVIVIDLSRLPSHGREVATFVRGRKATRHIPIVFVDGTAEKVEAVRKLLPDATYVPAAKLGAAVRQATANRPANPVVPTPMMQRYASRTAAQKLGIREGCMVGLIDPPRNYASTTGELPTGARFEETPAAPCDITLWFVDDAAACIAALPAMRKLAARTKLWLLWRKGSEVTQQFLRESAAAVGLVDYKICAVDKTWSGMLFARKKSV